LQNLKEKREVVMNKVIETLHAHRSIRKYKNKEVTDEILEEILLAATMASSSGNMQTYSIIVTRSEEMKEKMSEAHFHQSMLKDAPLFLTLCADFHRMRRWIKLSHAANNFDNYMSFMIASIDAILASQNAAIAAESLGLGICYMGTTLASATTIGEILELPDNVVPVVGFSLGYPDERPLLRKRLPLEGIVHYEKYKNYSNDDILEIYKEKEVAGIKRYKEVPELKAMIESENVENLAQIYTQLKYTEESHIKFSNDLLEYLVNQNFLKEVP